MNNCSQALILLFLLFSSSLVVIRNRLVIRCYVLFFLSSFSFLPFLYKQRENNIINDSDRDQIKAVIVNLMLSAPSTLQKQLSAALEIISDADFPSQWQNLLPVSILYSEC